MDITLPEFVKVTAAIAFPKELGGAAVNLEFKMKVKNNFNYFVFLDHSGTAIVSRPEYLAYFDEERNFFIMDYANPRNSFAGRIEATVLSKGKVDAALSAYQRYRGGANYPEGYEEKLLSALKLTESFPEFISRLRVNVELKETL